MLRLRRVGSVLLFLLVAPLALIGLTRFDSIALSDAAVPSSDGFFVDVTTRAGIDFMRQSDEKITGQAWGDYDGDGWIDLYLTDTAGPNRLYHNNADGTFSISSLSDQVALSDAYSAGAIFADYDNDGWNDLYVLNWGSNALYHNEDGQRFVDVSVQVGVADEANGKTAAWADYDEDGFIDLYVANWACSPKCGHPLEGDRDRLYHNNGDGTFGDATSALKGSGVRGAGFVASFLDYDNDGDSDIYLVNDEFVNPIGNVLWRNDGPGCDQWCFTDVSLQAGANTMVMGMGLATGDYDSDGDLDMYFSNAGPMTLLQNQGDGTFRDVAALAGVDLGREDVGWGSVFVDFDNDGWQDLYLGVSDTTATDQQPTNPLFHNNGDGTFNNMHVNSGIEHNGRTIGVAYADYDNDGRIDLLVGNYDSNYVLYRNVAPNNQRWVAIDLIGTGAVNRGAIGARVYVTTDDGRVQLQEVVCGSSLGAGNMLSLHFGLGQQNIREVKVVWPNGITQIFADVTANQRYTLTYSADGATTLRSQGISIAPTLLAALMVWVVFALGGAMAYISRHRRMSLQAIGR